MKRIWKKLGLRRMDEMERYIVLKAQRNAYLFLVAGLMAWSLYESCRVYLYHTRLNLLPGLLLGTAAVIQGFSQLALTHSAVKDNEDSMETESLVKILILACAVFGAAVTAAGAVLLMGVRV